MFLATTSDSLMLALMEYVWTNPIYRHSCTTQNFSFSISLVHEMEICGSQNSTSTLLSPLVKIWIFLHTTTFFISFGTRFPFSTNDYPHRGPCVPGACVDDLFPAMTSSRKIMHIPQQH